MKAAVYFTNPPNVILTDASLWNLAQMVPDEGHQLIGEEVWSKLHVTM